jgi:hypothetical protein
LKYGFPIGFTDRNVKFEQLELWKYRNHKGATEFPFDVNHYLNKEASTSCVIGPFRKNPFNTSIKISPLNTVPKKDTDEQRIILDLSMPKGQAVNDFVDKDWYLGERVDLVFPKVDDFIHLIRSKGRGCLLFKKDLRKAYRQISICPGDYHLVAFCWQKHIFCDTVLSMGLRSAAAICQRVTNAVAFIMYKLGIYILNYLDDLAGAESKDNAVFSYKCLGIILSKCGLKESVDKASPPSEVMTFLGVLFNTVTMTMEVTVERLEEIRCLVSLWSEKLEANLREVQSLIGKLNFVASCVRSGRIFISRLINWLKDLYKYSPYICVKIPIEVKKDILWWDKFLVVYNGVSIIEYDNWSSADSVLSTDASLDGCGGFFQGRYFHVKFPEFIRARNFSIAVLELLGVIIALRLWSSELKGRRMVINCDNEAVVQVLNSGRARCYLLQEGLREVCFLAACAQCEIKAVHLPGTSNRIADCLSRWSKGENFQVEFFKLTKTWKLLEYQVADSDFIFSNNW